MGSVSTERLLAHLAPQLFRVGPTLVSGWPSGGTSLPSGMLGSLGIQPRPALEGELRPRASAESSISHCAWPCVAVRVGLGHPKEAWFLSIFRSSSVQVGSEVAQMKTSLFLLALFHSR